MLCWYNQQDCTSIGSSDYNLYGIKNYFKNAKIIYIARV